MMNIINEEQVYKILIKYINNEKFQEIFKIINTIEYQQLTNKRYSEVLNNIFMNLENMIWQFIIWWYNNIETIIY